MDRFEGKVDQPITTHTTAGKHPDAVDLTGQSGERPANVRDVVQDAKNKRIFDLATSSERPQSSDVGVWDAALAYLTILGPEITECRGKQDARHGGPDHDDTHTWGEWTSFIMKYNDRAAISISHAEFESNLIHVAALAIAAIQSSRRKMPRPGRKP